MTEYFDHCEAACTTYVFHQSALRYILEEFHSNPDLNNIKYEQYFMKNGDGERLLQQLFDKSNVKMKMYGSAKELLENIKIYSNFPGSHQYFNAKLDPYFTTPIIYHSLKNEKFICKSDIFSILQSIVLRNLDEDGCPLFTSMVYFCLKSQEKLYDKTEFVPFDGNVFDEISKDLHLWNMNSNQLLAKLKSFVPNTWDQLECERISNLLLQSMDSTSHLDNNTSKCLIALLFTESKLTVEELQKFIKNRPELFQNQTKTVRLFEDGNKKFVMKAELFNALNIKYKDPDNIFDTISFQDALGVYKDKLRNIEFIRYPIQRAKHRAVPINGTETGSYCILAVDAFLDYMKHLIFEIKMFQVRNPPNWDLMKSTFAQMENDFSPDMKNSYFLRMHALEYRKSVFRCLCGKMSTKTIRPVKSNGFTLQDLKKELAHLDLTLAFPEIQKTAEGVYAHADNVKKEKYLRTCDLYDAVEIFPNCKKFLHNQGGCGRVPGLKCELCEAKKKEEKQKEALKLEGSKISGTESNSQTTLNTVTSSENSDFKSSEVPKVTMGAPDGQLTELNTKIACLEAQLASQSDKSTKLEADLVKATQQNELLHLEHIKLQSENEVNKGVMCQLIDKLSINQESPRSIPIVTSSTSLIECIICHIDIFNTQNTIKCPNCRIRFHKECALKYSKDHKECPSCKGTMKESALCLN